MTNTETLTEKQVALVDLFSTAIEGGVNYWASVSGYRWSERFAWADKGADLTETEYEDGETRRLTPALMLTGLNRVAKLCPGRRTNCGDTFAKLARTLGTDDQSDYDAGDADVIAQFGLGMYATYESRRGADDPMHGKVMETYG